MYSNMRMTQNHCILASGVRVQTTNTKKGSGRKKMITNQYGIRVD